VFIPVFFIHQLNQSYILAGKIQTDIIHDPPGVCQP
jgi:hypothetical protein